MADDPLAWKGSLWPARMPSPDELRSMTAEFERLRIDPDEGPALLAGLEEMSRRERTPDHLDPSVTPEAHAALAVRHLRERGVEVARGLTDTELDAVADVLGASVPGDLALLLRAGVPTGVDWPAWRDPAGVVAASREWIRNAFAFDIESNDYWLAPFGERPDGLADAIQQAMEVVSTWPTLVPIHGHTYTALTGGSSVISLWQAVDSIWSAPNLAHLLWHLAAVPVPAETSDAWSFPVEWVRAFDLDAVGE